MAGVAGCRESGLRMVRLRGALVLFAVTRVAIDVALCELPARVATVAKQSLMRAVEANTGDRKVVPRDVRPGSCLVALFAIVSEASSVPVILASYPVAVVASRRCALHHIVQMAILARDR